MLNFPPNLFEPGNDWVSDNGRHGMRVAENNIFKVALRARGFIACINTFYSQKSGMLVTLVFYGVPSRTLKSGIIYTLSM